MFFVGNFRHLPNGEAVEYLCQRHPPAARPRRCSRSTRSRSSAAGSTTRSRPRPRASPHVRMVGWVPSIAALPRAGAGLRGAAAARRRRQGQDRRVADGRARRSSPPRSAPRASTCATASTRSSPTRPADLAAGLARAAHRASAVAAPGRRRARARLRQRTTPEQVGERFLEIVEEVLAACPRSRRSPTAGGGRTSGASSPTATTVDAVERHARARSPSRARRCSSSRAATTRWWRSTGGAARTSRRRRTAAGPATTPPTARRRSATSRRCASAAPRYLAIPGSSFWWLHHYARLTAHLEARYRRIHSSEHLVVFDLGGRARGEFPPPGSRAGRVLVLGCLRTPRGEAPPRIVAELDRSERFTVTQRGARRARRASRRPAPLPTSGPRATGRCSSATRPCCRGASSTTSCGGDRDRRRRRGRALPAGSRRRHRRRGPPVTERLHGVLGREIEGRDPVPVLALRGGARRAGAGGLIDAVPIELATPLGDDDPLAYSDVRDVFVGDAGRPPASRAPQPGPPAPLISVLVATYDRPELLAQVPGGILRADAARRRLRGRRRRRRLARGRRRERVLASSPPRLPLTWTRIEHAGRSAAKNLAVMLARARSCCSSTTTTRRRPTSSSDTSRARAQPRGGGRRSSATPTGPPSSRSRRSCTTSPTSTSCSSPTRTSSRASAATGGRSGRAGSPASARCSCATACTTSGSTTRSTSRWRGGWPATGSRSSTSPPPAASWPGRSTSTPSAPQRGEGPAQAVIAALHPDAEIARVPAGRGRRGALAGGAARARRRSIQRIRELESEPSTTRTPAPSATSA